MCETGKRCQEAESCVARVDLLRKHICVLMVWVSILSLGLAASVALHFTLGQRSDTTKHTAAAVSGTHSQLTSYDPVEKNQGLQWQKKNTPQQNTVIRIEDDGNYFLFLRITLLSRNPGVNYTVTVTKITADDIIVIIVGHVNGTENSTGFMGKGVYLTEGTKLNITCSPRTGIDVTNSYLGLMKF